MKLVEILQGLSDGIFHQGDVVLCEDFGIRFELTTYKGCMVSVQDREPFYVDVGSYHFPEK